MAAAAQSIPRLFELVAERFASRVAIREDGVDVLYGDLARKAAATSAALSARAKPNGTPVILLLDPGSRLVIASLAALRSGAICLPLDPVHPRDRLAQIFTESGASAVLSESSHIGLARDVVGDAVPILAVDEPSTIEACAAADVAPNAPAYILYTSGSTGRPKGVLQTHRNLAWHVGNYARTLGVGPEDRLSLLYTPAFAAGLMDIYGALLNGATLHPYDVRKKGLTGLIRWLHDERISILHCVPTLYRNLVDEPAARDGFPSVRAIDLGGEPVTAGDVTRFRSRFGEGCRLVNHLAFTEASVSAQYVIDRTTALSGGTVPVGREAEGIEIRIIAEDGREAAPGEIGEIVVASEYLSPGYWRDPELTAKSFSVDGTRRLYHTGDLGMRQEDGLLMHLGRKDFRLKIRGHTVEAAEVEGALREIAGVRDAAVVGSTTAGGDVLLVAYLVKEAEPNLDAAALRRSLAPRLPDFMIPSRFLSLDALPLTPTGKVDRRSLPPIPAESASARGEPVAPSDPLELRMLEIWQGILDVESIGVDDDFFDLGGHSLLALKLVSRIEEISGRSFGLEIVAQAPTIKAQAELLRREGWEPPHETAVALQTRGDMPAFFCVPGAGSDVLALADLARFAGSDRPFYGLQAPGLADGERPIARVETLAAYFVEAIRKVQPGGPYFVGGSSYGGMVAFEIASQLLEHGERVGFVGLIDAYAPGYPPLRPDAPLRYRAFHLLGTPITRAPEETTLHIRAALREVWTDRYRCLVYPLAGRALPRPLRYFRVRQAAFRATRRYRLKPYPGRLTLFRAVQPSAELYRPDPHLGWRDVALGGIDVREIPGRHGAHIRRPHVPELGAKLREALLEATRITR